MCHRPTNVFLDCFTRMRKLVFILCLFLSQSLLAQKNVRISFLNDYQDVYNLSLIIYTPDGKNQTRVSNLQPGGQKQYVFPAGTELYIADQKQAAFAMKGNDIKASGAKPNVVLKDSAVSIMLSSLAQTSGTQQQGGKQ
jgi:hypothetical protein